MCLSVCHDFSFYIHRLRKKTGTICVRYLLIPLASRASNPNKALFLRFSILVFVMQAINFGNFLFCVIVDSPGSIVYVTIYQINIEMEILKIF